MKNIDIFILALFLFLLVGGFFFVKTFTDSVKNECLRSPLVFGAKQYEVEGLTQVGGSIFIIKTNYTGLTRPLIINFNTTGVYPQK